MAALALDWAVREVAAQGSSLRISSTEANPTSLHRDGVDDLHEQRLARVLASFADKRPNLVVDLTATHGNPRRALIEDAGNADLLVLAASHEESVEAVLLESLAKKAVRRSPCPVVIVRGSHTTPSSANRGWCRRIQRRCRGDRMGLH